MNEITFRAMGSEIYCAVDSKHRRVKERLERVPAMFEAWEKTLSRFRADSELSQLNSRSGENVRVSETLWRVLKLARRAETWSEGLVTPLILNALEAAGYTQSFQEMQNNFLATNAYPSQGNAVNPLPRWEMNSTTHSIRVEPGARLDLGGIAKGWAAEQTAQYLGEVGATMVDAGGDMVMNASPRWEGAWYVGIENPFAPDDDAGPVLQITRGAVATSGRDYRKWTRDGVPAHHLIDPRTNLPAVTDVLTATVIAPTIFQAEVAAKVALLLGSGQALAWLQSQRELAARLILENREIVMTQEMEKFLV